jgi:hypothetical protein
MAGGGGVVGGRGGLARVLSHPRPMGFGRWKPLATSLDLYQTTVPFISGLTFASKRVMDARVQVMSCLAWRFSSEI